MKILVADKIAPAGVEYFMQQDGLEVIEAYGSSPDKILELCVDVAAVVVRSETQVTAEVIEAAKELKVVGRAGVGVDNIDIEAATQRGIIVMNTPGGNTLATAELTFTHMLCAARPIAQACASMRAGRWDRKLFTGKELANKTLGVLGMGRIGSEVARRAQAFGMEVVAFDPYLTEGRARTLGVETVAVEEIYRRSDYVTIHMPLTEDTRHMIDETAIEKMKDGVRLFNCARGGIIKESALLQALESGKVAAAGLDVYEDEPLAEDSPLRQIENLVLTPHLGASTAEAQESVGLEIAEAVTQVLRGGVVRNAINMPSVDARTLSLLRPYLDLGEKLGTIVQQISPESVEKIRITYWGKVAELDAMPLNRAIQRGFLKQITGDDINDVNAPLKLKNLGIEVEATKSNTDSDYTELVQVETETRDGERGLAAGTLIGKSQRPRVVHVNGHDVDFEPQGVLLFMKNEDRPGIVGMLGTLLGRENVNIANLSLARKGSNGRDREVRAVYELDSVPESSALDEIRGFPGVKTVQIVRL